MRFTTHLQRRPVPVWAAGGWSWGSHLGLTSRSGPATGVSWRQRNNRTVA